MNTKNKTNTKKQDLNLVLSILNQNKTQEAVFIESDKVEQPKTINDEPMIIKQKKHYIEPTIMHKKLKYLNVEQDFIDNMVKLDIKSIANFNDCYHYSIWCFDSGLYLFNLNYLTIPIYIKSNQDGHNTDMKYIEFFFLSKKDKALFNLNLRPGTTTNKERNLADKLKIKGSKIIKKERLSKELYKKHLQNRHYIKTRFKNQKVRERRLMKEFKRYLLQVEKYNLQDYYKL